MKNQSPFSEREREREGEREREKVKHFINKIQSNFNGSNTDGSFTMAYSNSFLSLYGIFPIAQENKLGEIFLCYYEIVCCSNSNEYTQHTIILLKIENISINIAVFFLTWRHDEISLARTTHLSNKFPCPEAVRAIKV